MNKIVFLDIDGVVNTFGDKELIANTFEKNKLETVIELLLLTDAKLVIISDRRLLSEERIMIENVFDEYKILVNYLNFKRTHKNRSDEILEYLNDNPCEQFVILDDNDLGYTESEILKPHFLDTYKQGFTRELFFKATIILSFNRNI